MTKLDAANTDRAEASALRPARPYIELKDVSLIYGSGREKTTAVEGLDLSVKKGEFIAVVGSSGCGKSSLMRLVTGLTMPSSGEITFEGRPVIKPIQSVGMAFQAPTMMPWRTTLRNVMLPFEVVSELRGKYYRNQNKYREKVVQTLGSVGLQGFEEKYPWQLSGGMQQRANVSRALVHDPDLLMLDEPFGALDAFTREELWGVTQQLWLDRKFSCILVTHDLREAVFLADTVYVMSKRPGRMIVRREIDLERPRSLERTFDPDFVDIVHELRAHIAEERP